MNRKLTYGMNVWNTVTLLFSQKDLKFYIKKEEDK
jgi:hypothetical protein